jgi:hypothetical protein
MDANTEYLLTQALGAIAIARQQIQFASQREHLTRAEYHLATALVIDDVSDWVGSREEETA